MPQRAKDSRPSARRRGYDAAHEKWRAAVLRRDPVCRMCGAAASPSDHADHIVPISKGGARLDPANGQRLCPACHNSHKKAFEMSGTIRGCDASGFPVDPGHLWHDGGRGIERFQTATEDRARTIAVLSGKDSARRG